MLSGRVIGEVAGSFVIMHRHTKERGVSCFAEQPSKPPLYGVVLARGPVQLGHWVDSSSHDRPSHLVIAPTIFFVV